jgi:L-alanine-DL-glutamate epimerase-like enolase superfamily enzyme
VLWGNTIEETARVAREFVDLGFQAVKFGFGPIGDRLDRDIAMVSAARAILGEKNDLMVDVGRRWSLERAIEGCFELARFGVAWVEEPLHPDDLDGYARLTSTVPVPIAAAETETTLAGFKAFLDAGVEVIQPDLGRVGLSQGMKIARLARESGARCIPHCFGTGVNTAASIHWMAAVGGDLCEYPMRTNPLCRDLVVGCPPLVDGFVRPSDRPGLGVDLNERVVLEHRITGTGR